MEYAHNEIVVSQEIIVLHQVFFIWRNQLDFFDEIEVLSWWLFFLVDYFL
jgi:hypothetical protein